MYEEINQELEALQVLMHEGERVERFYDEYREMLKELEKKSYTLSRQLEKENMDVEKINKMSMATLFYKVLGSYEKQSEKERQEALAAQLRWEQCEEELSTVRTELEHLAQKRIDCLEAKDNYERLFEKKRQSLLESGTGAAERILEISKQVGKEKADLKEIEEAIDVGHRALDILARISSSLNSAGDWGVWDMVGGGLITDIMKHSHIDDAKALTYEVQTVLTRFNIELADISMTSEVNIEVDGFGKFADFFFDGLIADWCMQSSINTSKESTVKVEDEVSRVMNKLNELQHKRLLQINQMEAELKETILNI